MKTRRIMYKSAINEALKEEFERDERVFLIGEDVDIRGGVFKISKGLKEIYGESRVKGTPISESAFVGLATGAAMCGLRPVVELMYMDFSLVAMDQIVNQMASISYMSGGKLTIPIVIRGQIGIGTREAAQHSRQIESWFIHTPGMKVVMPSTVYDAKGLLKSAIRDDNPILFLENRNLYDQIEEVPQGDWIVSIGEGIVCREGRDITVVATSFALNKVLAAAEELFPSIETEVIDPRTLNPLDIDLIANSVKKTGRLLVATDENIKAGFGAEVVRIICERFYNFLSFPPRVIGFHDVPVPFSPVLEDEYMLSKEKVIDTIKEMIKE